NDFVAGELERAILGCVNESSPELILIEGQSALRHPSGPGGPVLMLSGGAKHVVLHHDPRRKFYLGKEELGLSIPDVIGDKSLIEQYGAILLGVSLAGRIDEARVADCKNRLHEEFGVPVAVPLSEGVQALVAPLRDLITRYSY